MVLTVARYHSLTRPYVLVLLVRHYRLLKQRLMRSQCTYCISDDYECQLQKKILFSGEIGN
jgi:hypothetical protein